MTSSSADLVTNVDLDLILWFTDEKKSTEAALLTPNKALVRIRASKRHESREKLGFLAMLEGTLIVSVLHFLTFL